MNSYDTYQRLGIPDPNPGLEGVVNFFGGPQKGPTQNG